MSMEGWTQSCGVLKFERRPREMQRCLQRHASACGKWRIQQLRMSMSDLSVNTITQGRVPFLRLL